MKERRNEEECFIWCQECDETYRYTKVEAKLKSVVGIDPDKLLFETRLENKLFGVVDNKKKKKKLGCSYSLVKPVTSPSSVGILPLREPRESSLCENRV